MKIFIREILQIVRISLFFVKLYNNEDYKDKNISNFAIFVLAYNQISQGFTIFYFFYVN